MARAAVASNAVALEFCSERLRADKALVLAAVAASGGMLYYAAPALRADPDVVFAATQSDGRALQWAAPALAVLDLAALAARAGHHAGAGGGAAGAVEVIQIGAAAYNPNAMSRRDLHAAAAAVVSPLLDKSYSSTVTQSKLNAVAEESEKTEEGAEEKEASADQRRQRFRRVPVTAVAAAPSKPPSALGAHGRLKLPPAGRVVGDSLSSNVKHATAEK